MTQTLSLNIVVLLVLVLLLASIYRVRSSARLRLWMLGWLAVLLRFALLLWQPTLLPLERLQDTLALSLLVLCGLAFVLSLSVLQPGRRRLTVALVLGMPALIFVTLACFGVPARPVFLLLELLGHAAALVSLWYFYRDRLVVASIATVLVLLCAHAVLYAVLVYQPISACYYILTEFFAAYAVLFAADQRRLTAGSLTMGTGLLAWAAVFPLALLVAHRWPHLGIFDEVWNVPKFVVALGMIVTLLEDEIALASAQRAQYQMLFEHNPLPMWISEPAGALIVEVNEAAIREYGYSRDRFLELGAEELLNAGASGDGEPLFSEAHRQSGPWRLKTPAGETRLVETSAQPVEFASREALLVLVQDVTEREQLHEQLIHQANHDPLTGLPNRLLLEDRMKAALASAARHGTRAAVLCLDLDRFKQINDTFGHAVGDSCLKEVAARLRQRLRTVDTAARTGGEEFMVILEEIKTAADAQRVTEDLLFTLGAPHIAEGKRIQMSASVGIALYPDDAREATDLWRMADAAMYRAKGEGGNRLRFFARAAERER